MEKINNAPGFRINHILEDIDRQVNELQMVAEAMANFTARCQRVSWKVSKITGGIALLLFLFGDVLLKSLISYPESTMITAVRNGTFSLGNLIIPIIFALVVLAIGALSFSKVIYPQMLKRALANGADLVRIDNDYRKNLWKKLETKVRENLEGLSVRDIWSGYGRSLAKIQGFLNVDLKRYYNKIVK
ncbi:hypothetical protein [Desulfomarina profundi]|uniref:hypothetical protein n=1 Tax=Desulfomarina profundi TaxID=2772557 RepID=UPI001E5D702A|nr:hypothetical protein [Desulfomarina profundi]